MTLASLFSKQVEDAAHSLGTFVDPFGSKNVERILIWVGRRPFAPGFDIHADIKFKRGDTTGEHTIRADTLEALLPLIRNFLEGLPE